MFGFFLICLRNLCPTPRSWRISHTFSSGNFVVLPFIFQSKIHLKLIFVKHEIDSYFTILIFQLIQHQTYFEKTRATLIITFSIFITCETVILYS